MAKTLTIAGSNYLPYFKTSTARIRETLRKSNVMNCQIVTKGIVTAPQEGSELVYKDDTRFLFGGYISKVEPQEVGMGQQFTFDVEVSDYSYIFNSKVARRAYENKTLLEIVTDLMDTYVDASYGFDITNVQTGPTLNTVSFDHINIKSCLDKLTKLTGYVWWVDYEKKLYFQTETTTAAPETVTDAKKNMVEAKISYDTSQVRNSVIVIGSTEGIQSLDLITETFTGDDETRSWPLENKPSEVTQITINGVSKQFSLDVNERDTDIFLYSYSGQNFKLTNAPTTPTGSDTIVISYYPRIPVIVQQTDPVSINICKVKDGGDGIYEYTIKEPSITSIEEATERAQEELRQYSMPLVSGKIVTRTDLLTAGSIFKPGQFITVNLPSYNLNVDTVFLIQEVQIEVEEGSETQYTYTIIFGGKIVGLQEFLELLAAQQEKGTNATDTGEIITIEHVTDVFEFTDSGASADIVTPPFQYAPSGSPKGVWGLSEWS